MTTYNLNRGLKYKSPMRSIFWFLVTIVNLAILLPIVKLWLYL